VSSDSRGAAADSDRIAPSAIWKMRSAYPSSRWSCVTTSTVAPRTRAVSWSRSITCWPFSQSRALVGSSANTNDGFFTSARAIATRCFSPPDRAIGRRCDRPLSPSWPSTWSARLRASRSEHPSPHRSTTSNCCRAVSAGNRLYPWKMYEQCRSRNRSIAVSPSPHTSCPSAVTRPPSGRSNADSTARSVDLPLPLGPMSRFSSPGCSSSDTPLRA
jgi:hypothetical protein